MKYTKLLITTLALAICFSIPAFADDGDDLNKLLDLPADTKKKADPKDKKDPKWIGR